MKILIIIIFYQLLQFNIALSEQIGIGIKQEPIFIKKSGDYYLLICDNHFAANQYHRQSPELLILNNKLELIDTVNVRNYYIQLDYIYAFRNTKVIGNNLFYIMSPRNNSPTTYNLIKRNLIEKTEVKYELPGDINDYNNTVYFDDKYVVYVYKNQDIIIEEFSTHNTLKIINDNEHRHIHYENGFLYYIKDKSIISYNIKLDFKKGLKNISEYPYHFDFVANEDYLALSYVEPNIYGDGYIGFYDLKNDKKMEHLIGKSLPEYMKIVNDKLYYNTFKRVLIDSTDSTSSYGVTNTNESFVLDINTRESEYLGEDIFPIGQDSLISYSNRSINLIDNFGNNEKKYLINELPIDVNVKNNRLCFVKENEVNELYNGNLECIDLTSNQRVIDDIKNINSYKLDDNYLYYLKENKLFRLDLLSKSEEHIYSNELNFLNTIECFDFDDNYFYLAGNKGKLYLLNRNTNLIDSNFNELSGLFIKIIKSYKNKVIILFSKTYDGFFLDATYLDKNNLAIGSPILSKLPFKLGTSNWPFDQITDISKDFTYDEVNDKLYFLNGSNFDIYESDFNSARSLNLDFNKNNNIYSIRMHDNLLLATSSDSVYLIDVNNSKIVKSEKYEIENIRIVNDEFENFKNSIINFVVNEDYVIIIDKHYNIYKYNTQKLSVIINKFKDTDCENSVEVEYFDINGKEIKFNSINNKLLIVKYKCLENNNFYYKLEFRE
jgi:hypothetical protein